MDVHSCTSDLMWVEHVPGVGLPEKYDGGGEGGEVENLKKPDFSEANLVP